MRVLHVAPTAFGASGLFGGGERYPLELARALSRRGDIDCTLVTFGRRESETVDDSGLTIRTLRSVAHLGGHPAHPVAPALVGALRGADLVHVHHLRSLPARIVAATSIIARRPVVVTDHGLAGGDWFGLLPRLFDRSLAVSAYSQSLLRFPPDRSRVVYGGADPHRFRPGPDAERAGVVFVGRLTPHKGVDRLLAALPEGACLTIAGTGGHDAGWPERGYVDYLRRLAGDRAVRFVGAVDDDELASLYRRAAVVAVPSVDVTCYGRRIAVSELLGLTTLEAMASGAAIVASRIGGLREIVFDGHNGFLVEPGDVVALRRRLEVLLSDRRRARSMGRAGRQLVLGRFTWAECAQRCVSSYHELLT